MTLIEFSTETGSAFGSGLSIVVLKRFSPLPMWACILIGLPLGAVVGWAFTLGIWMIFGTVWYFFLGRHHKKPWETVVPNAPQVRSSRGGMDDLAGHVSLGAAMSEARPLHRLFGLSWMDFFRGTDIVVETEMDLSLKQQFLDVVIIHKGTTPIPRPLPDGFDELAAHNLLTFKSHRDTLDDWTLCELVGHYVNYRKQYSPSMQHLLPPDDFRLFAVCAHYPRDLAQEVALAQVQAGVHEVRVLTLTIRIIVVSELPLAEPNAMLHLFSASEKLLRYGREHYRPHSPESSTLLYQLLQIYKEDPNMADKLQEFVRQSIDEILASLPAEERLKGLPAEELRKRLSTEERLKGLSADEVVKALPPETLEALIRRLKANGSSPQSP